MDKVLLLEFFNAEDLPAFLFNSEDSLLGNDVSFDSHKPNLSPECDSDTNITECLDISFLDNKCDDHHFWKDFVDLGGSSTPLRCSTLLCGSSTPLRCSTLLCGSSTPLRCSTLLCGSSTPLHGPSTSLQTVHIADNESDCPVSNSGATCAAATHSTSNSGATNAAASLSDSNSGAACAAVTHSASNLGSACAAVTHSASNSGSLRCCRRGVWQLGIDRDLSESEQNVVAPNVQFSENCFSGHFRAEKQDESQSVQLKEGSKLTNVIKYITDTTGTTFQSTNWTLLDSGSDGPTGLLQESDATEGKFHTLSQSAKQEGRIDRAADSEFIPSKSDEHPEDERTMVLLVDPSTAEVEDNLPDFVVIEESGDVNIPKHVVRKLSKQTFEKKNASVQNCQSKLKIHQCSFCEYNTRHKTHLLAHQRTHTGERPYSCGVCPYTSAQKSCLMTHLQTHSGDRPHKCPYCPYSTIQRYNLLVHTRKHTGEKPHLCPHCPYETSRRCDLTHHLRTHTGEKPYECMFCPYKAAIKRTVLHHVLSKHTKEKPHQCPHCAFRTARRDGLKLHVSKRHPTAPTPHSLRRQC